MNARTQSATRRSRLLREPPERYCFACSSIVWADEERCTACQAERPAREPGWPPLETNLDPWLGRRVGDRYVLIQRIGRGASASVYRAEAVAIARQFAVKIIHPSKSGADDRAAKLVRARLAREVEALGRLRNPHISRISDILELPFDHVGLVMDLIQGETLEQIVTRQGPMAVSRACSLARQMANGIYEAHLAGMVHRDLKPENIMVERMPAGDEFVHVLDFGVVHMDDETGVTHGFVGTPLYASPEQATGSEIDARSDVYSLGAIIFFLLCARPPFEGKSVMSVLRQHVEAPPPSIRALRGDREVSGAFEALIRSMLAKKKRDRPASLDQVIAELDAVCAQEPTLEADKTELLAASELAEHAELDASSTARGHGPGARASQNHQEAEGAPRPEIPPTIEVEPTEPESPPQAGILARVRRPAPPASAPARLSRPVVMRELERPAALRGSLSVWAVGPESSFAAIGDGALYLWRDREAPRRFELSGRRAPPTAVALGTSAALVGRADGAIERVAFDRASLSRALFRPPRPTPITALAVDAITSTAIAGTGDGRVYFLGPSRPEHDWLRVRSGDPVASIALGSAPGTDTFAVGRRGGLVEIAPITDPRSTRSSIRTAHTPISLAFSPDGYLIGACDGDRSVALYQLYNAQHVIDVRVESPRLLGFEFAQGGNTTVGFVERDDRLYVATLKTTAQT